MCYRFPPHHQLSHRPGEFAEFDLVANALDRDRSYLLNEAVETYFGEQRRFAAMVEEGREDICSSRTFDHEEVKRLVGKRERKGKVKVPWSAVWVV